MTYSNPPGTSYLTPFNRDGKRVDNGVTIPTMTYMTENRRPGILGEYCISRKLFCFHI